MHCPFCNNLIPDESKFCPDCGKRITQKKEISTENTSNYSFSQEYISKKKRIESSVHFSFVGAIIGFPVCLLLGFFLFNVEIGTNIIIALIVSIVYGYISEL